MTTKRSAAWFMVLALMFLVSGPVWAGVSGYNPTGKEPPGVSAAGETKEETNFRLAQLAGVFANEIRGLKIKIVNLEKKVLALALNSSALAKDNKKQASELTAANQRSAALAKRLGASATEKKIMSERKSLLASTIVFLAVAIAACAFAGFAFGRMKKKSLAMAADRDSFKAKEATAEKPDKELREALAKCVRLQEMNENLKRCFEAARKLLADTTGTYISHKGLRLAVESGHFVVSDSKNAKTGLEFKLYCGGYGKHGPTEVELQNLWGHIKKCHPEILVETESPKTAVAA